MVDAWIQNPTDERFPTFKNRELNKNKRVKGKKGKKIEFHLYLYSKENTALTKTIIFTLYIHLSVVTE